MFNIILHSWFICHTCCCHIKITWIKIITAFNIGDISVFVLSMENGENTFEKGSYQRTYGAYSEYRYIKDKEEYFTAPRKSITVKIFYTCNLTLNYCISMFNSIIYILYGKQKEGVPAWREGFWFYPVLLY